MELLKSKSRIEHVYQCALQARYKSKLIGVGEDTQIESFAEFSSERILKVVEYVQAHHFPRLEDLGDILTEIGKEKGFWGQYADSIEESHFEVVPYARDDYSYISFISENGKKITLPTFAAVKLKWGRLSWLPRKADVRIIWRMVLRDKALDLRMRKAMLYMQLTQVTDNVAKVMAKKPPLERIVSDNHICTLNHLIEGINVIEGM